MLLHPSGHAKDRFFFLLGRAHPNEKMVPFVKSTQTTTRHLMVRIVYEHPTFGEQRHPVAPTRSTLTISLPTCSTLKTFLPISE